MDPRTPLAAGLDTAAVVMFVAIGRREHERDSAIAGLVDTAAPFLVALALTWLALRAWRSPLDLRTGVGVWAGTLAGGMVLRNLVFGDGTAMSFVVVAATFLAVSLIGWRVIAGAIVHRRDATTDDSPASRTTA